MDHDVENMEGISVAAKNFQYSVAHQTVDSFDRDLLELHDQIRDMCVRTHMLEVDLATLFSPDQLIELEKLGESCSDCTQSLETLGSEDLATFNTELRQTLPEQDISLLLSDVTTCTELNEANKEDSHVPMEDATETCMSLVEDGPDTSTSSADSARTNTNIVLAEGSTETSTVFVEGTTETNTVLVERTAETITVLLEGAAQTNTVLVDGTAEPKTVLVECKAETRTLLVEGKTESSTMEHSRENCLNLMEEQTKIIESNMPKDKAC